MEKILQSCRGKNKNVKVVSVDWINESLKSKKRVSESPFMIAEPKVLFGLFS